MHKREDHRASRSLEQESAKEEAAVRSPVKERAADADVKRATHGLIRLEHQRRNRMYLRRMVMVVALVLLIVGLHHYLADYVPRERFAAYWEELQMRLPHLFKSET